MITMCALLREAATAAIPDSRRAHLSDVEESESECESKAHEKKDE